MDTGGPHDRNTRQCRKTLQQIFLVYFLHGLYTTCTEGGAHDRNTSQCRTTTHQTFPVSFLHGLYLTCTREDPTNLTCVFSSWVIPHTYTGNPNKYFLVYFLHGLYFTCARQNPTTVTSASVAKQDIKHFVCLFCMGSIPHMYTGGPHDRNTRQCRTTTQQNFPVSSLHGSYLTCTREGPTTVTPASVAKQHNKPFLCFFCMGYTSHVHGRTPRP